MADLENDKKDQEQPDNSENEEQAGSEIESSGGAENTEKSQEKPADNEQVENEEIESPADDGVEAEEADSSADADKNESDSSDEDSSQENYYDDYYTENDDVSDYDSEGDASDSEDEGGPIIPDKPESDEDVAEEPGGENSDESDEESSEVEEGEKKMPFLEHLEELRWTLLRSLLAVFLGAIISFVFSKQIVNFLRLPGPEDMKLIYLSPTEGFMIYIKVSIFSGLVVALPYVAYEFWRFVVPGLLSKERKLVPPIVFFTVFCFLLGGSFAYLVIIPFALNFLLGFQTAYLEATITIGKYLGFVVTLILVFGVVFELPVLSFFLSKIGLLTPEFLRSKRRYGIVSIVIIAALLTPPDIVTQIMLAIPLIILYEISIFVSAAVVKKKIKEESDAD